MAGEGGRYALNLAPPQRAHRRHFMPGTSLPRPHGSISLGGVDLNDDISIDWMEPPTGRLFCCPDQSTGRTTGPERTLTTAERSHRLWGVRRSPPGGTMDAPKPVATHIVTANNRSRRPRLPKRFHPCPGCSTDEHRLAKPEDAGSNPARGTHGSVAQRQRTCLIERVRIGHPEVPVGVRPITPLGDAWRRDGSHEPGAAVRFRPSRPRATGRARAGLQDRPCEVRFLGRLPSARGWITDPSPGTPGRSSSNGRAAAS